MCWHLLHHNHKLSHLSFLSCKQKYKKAEGPIEAEEGWFTLYCIEFRELFDISRHLFYYFHLLFINLQLYELEIKKLGITTIWTIKHTALKQRNQSYSVKIWQKISLTRNSHFTAVLFPACSQCRVQFRTVLQLQRQKKKKKRIFAGVEGEERETKRVKIKTEQVGSH